MFFSFLHLHEQFLNMLMRFIDLACEVRKIGVEVDFGARDRPMARIAAHIEEIHPRAFELGELGNVQITADPVKNIFDGPFRDGATWVAMGVRQKNALLCLGPIAASESGTIFLDIFDQTSPGWMRKDNDARHLVFAHLSADLDRMRLSVNIVKAQEHNLLATQSSIMGQQHNDLISDREPRQDILQDCLPLPLIWNPRDGHLDRNETTALPTYPFTNRVDGITAMTEPDRPAVKAPQSTEAPPDGRRGKF